MELLKEELKEELKGTESFIEYNYEFPYDYYYANLKDRIRKGYNICLKCNKEQGSFFIDKNSQCNCNREKNCLLSSYIDDNTKEVTCVHVAKVKYNKRYFETLIKKISFVFKYNEDKLTYEKVSEKTISQVTVKFEIIKKGAVNNKMDGNIEVKEFNKNGIDIKNYKILKSNLIKVFGDYHKNIVDFKENILKLCLTCYEGLIDNFIAEYLWGIYTNYKNFYFLVENDIQLLKCSNIAEKKKVIENLQKKDFYFDALVKEINIKKDNIKSTNFNNLMGYYNVSMKDLYIKYPSTDPKFYEILDVIEKSDFNVDYFYSYFKQSLTQSFLKANYTAEEVKQYIEISLMQLFKIRDYNIDNTYQLLSELGLPMVKFPKNMDIFYNRINVIYKFYKNHSKYVVKKAFEIKNGQELLDKFMFWVYKKRYAFNFDKNNKIIFFKKNNYDKEAEIIACYDENLNEISVEEMKNRISKGDNI